MLPNFAARFRIPLRISKDAGSYVSVLPNCLGSRLSLRYMILRSHLVEACEEAGAPQIRGS